jgi:hypothetical protein
MAVCSTARYKTYAHSPRFCLTESAGNRFFSGKQNLEPLERIYRKLVSNTEGRTFTVVPPEHVI